MRWWVFIWLVGAAFGSGAAGAVPRLGYLVLSPLSEPPSAERAAFLARLEALGHRPGDTLEVVYRSAEWDADALPALAAELVARGVDIIVAVSSEAAMAARDATDQIPIVFAPASAPIRDGLVQDLARPGGNLTGVSLFAPKLGAKRLDLLKEAFPNLARVALLWDVANAGADAQRRATEWAAAQLGVTLDYYPVRGGQDLAAGLERLAADLPDALVVFTDSRTVSYRAILADFALRHRLPTMFGLRVFVEADGLMSYGPSVPALFRRAADHVDRILGGADPGRLPVEQPMRFELVINLTTARRLGRSIASGVLFRADRVLE